MIQKLYKYSNMIIILAIILVYILLMSPYDDITSYMHDGRYWTNQYMEWYHTFPKVNLLNWTSFNQTGLAFNMFYPNNTLRLLELPFIFLHIQNFKYIVNTFTLLQLTISFWVFYQILKQEEPMNNSSDFKTHNISKSILLTLIIQVPLETFYNNSTPQIIATMLIILGTYSLYFNKYWLTTLVTIGLLNDSLSYTIIGCLTFLIVYFITPQSKDRFIKTLIAGLLGIMISMPIIWPILKHLNQVSKPTDQFADYHLTFFNYTDLSNFEVHLTRLFVLSIPLIWIIITTPLKKLQKTQIIIFTSMLLFVLIAISPKLLTIISSPIQPGVWTRIWPLYVVLAMFLLKSNLTKSFNLYTYIPYMLIATIALGISYYRIGFISANNLENKGMGIYLKQKDYDKWSNNIQTQWDFQLKNNPNPIYVSAHHTARTSPDYMPARATLNDNTLMFTPQKTLKHKYGLTKKAINHGQGLQIKINPNKATIKTNKTPLAVWRYDFMDYKITTTHGKVIQDKKHVMFYYNGSKPTTITITTK